MENTTGRRFASATAVEQVGRAGDGISYRAEVHDGWDIGGNANGGYLLAIAGRAMAAAAERPPLTITGHFLRPAPAGQCAIDVEVVRAGRRLATASATLVLDGHPTLRVLGTFGEQQAGGTELTSETPVALPPFDQCPRRPETGEMPGLVRNLDIRLHPDDGQFGEGRPSGSALVRGWFALIDDEPIDACTLLLAADAFPPPIFNTAVPAAWVPTVELTVHVRGVPAPGPLRCAFRSRFIANGLIDEDGEIWDADGQLVAQSRQLSLVPRPPA